MSVLQRCVYICFLFIFLPLIGKSQPLTKRLEQWVSNNPMSKINLKVVPIPLLARSPETGWQAGAGLSWVFKTTQDSTLRKRTRTSNLSAQVSYSQMKQTDIEVAYGLFLPQERAIFRGQLGYVSFFDRFWGIGNENSSTNLSNWQYRRVFIQGRSYYKIVNKSFFGSAHRFQQIANVTWTNPAVADTYVPGARGSFATGVGAAFLADYRDNPLSAHSGWYVEMVYLPFTTKLGGQYNFNELTLDIRKYFPFKGPFTTLALQYLMVNTQGDVPLREMPRLGSAQIMRGYFAGRYRDFSYQAMQAEFRFPIWGRIHASTFIAAGHVAPAFSTLWHQKLHFSAGFGIRILLNTNERLYGRADLGVTEKGTTGSYIRMNEAF